MRFAGRMVVSRAFVAILFQVYLGTPRAAMHSPVAINVDFLWTVYLGSAGSLPAFIHPFNAWTVPRRSSGILWFSSLPRDRISRASSGYRIRQGRWITTRRTVDAIGIDEIPLVV